LLEPDPLHGISPLVSSRLLGRDALFSSVLRMPLPMASGTVSSTYRK
jgi:hypothetical protein